MSDGNPFPTASTAAEWAVEVFAELVAKQLVAHLAAAGFPPTTLLADGEQLQLGADRYSTEQPHWPPRTRSRRHARDLIRRVPGHERFGLGRATEWRVGAAAYHRYYSRRGEVAVGVTVPPDVDSWIESAGYRSTQMAHRRRGE